MEFTKMEAAGNDFVIFDGFKYNIDNYRELAINACDRHFSVGGDGIMICKESNTADLKMVYYNSDGTEGEMCGNGIRCFSKYAYENNIISKTTFTVETLAGIKTIYLELDEEQKVKSIEVNMGKPIFEPSAIPVKLNKDKVLEERLEIDGKELVFSSVLVGVPHTIIFIDDMDYIDINYLGRKIENHPMFPEKTNVNFVKIIERNKINIYTWERGAGRTLGCGTGSSASVVIGNLLGKLDQKVHVITEGGELEIQLREGEQIFMRGGANTICIGQFCNIE